LQIFSPDDISGEDEMMRIIIKNERRYVEGVAEN
jgi:hypothetical protein